MDDEMDNKELHDWMIASFGPLQGEAAFAQFSQLPDSLKEQILAQGVAGLPKPAEVHDLVQAFTDGGINTMADVDKVAAAGPINVSLAKSLAARKAQDGSVDTVSAAQAEQARAAVSTVNLWLDSATSFDPAPGTVSVVSPSGWTEASLDSWIKLSLPVAKAMNQALTAVFADRLGGAFDGEVSSMFAGPVPIPIPEGLKDPRKLMQLLGSTSFGMQLGQAAGSLAHEVFGSFDQGLAMSANPAGALLPENIEKFAGELELPRPEVLSFLALRESAHARLFSGVPWLMPRVESLIGKYARNISIDLDAVEEQLRDADGMNPEGIAGAVNMTKVGMSENDEQTEALDSLETLLALVEGWVDAVVWRAGSPFLPHIEPLREMMRRRRAAGGPAEQTFENLIGLKLRPRKLREAAALWEGLTLTEGLEARDAHWSHPDRLPVLAAGPETRSRHPATGPALTTGQPTAETGSGASQATAASDLSETAAQAGGPESGPDESAHGPNPTDWDAELSKLLAAEGGLPTGNPLAEDSAGGSGQADQTGQANQTGHAHKTDNAGGTDQTGGTDSHQADSQDGLPHSQDPGDTPDSPDGTGPASPSD